MRHNFRYSIFVLMVLLGIYIAEAKLTLYVSPDAKQGDGSRNKPFTLTEARDWLRENKWKDDRAKQGVVVLLMPGQYHLEETFELTKRDSGTANAPVMYRALKAGQARLIGGIQVDTGDVVADKAALSKLSESAREKVRVIDLAKVKDLGKLSPRGFTREGTPAPLELFIDGQPQRLAGWPDEGFEKIASKVTQSSFSISQDIPAEKLAAWAKESDLWVHGYWTHDWADSYEKVAKVDAEQRSITTQPPHGVYGYKAGARFRVLNALCELDQPGEYYVDRAAKKLYYWADQESLSEPELIVSTLEQPLIKTAYAEHITFSNLTLEAGRNDAAHIIKGKQIRFEGCVIRNMGRGGIMVYDGQEHAVVGCDLYQLGESGVQLQGGDRKTLTPGKHLVHNNHIHHFGRWIRTYRPAVLLQGVGNTVTNNDIHDGPHAAILIDGNDHQIARNKIQRVVLETGDAGAIYIGRDWSERGHVIEQNLIADVRSDLAFGASAVYLDDLASGVTIRSNIFARCGVGVVIGGGRDNAIASNLFYENTHAIHVDSRGEGWAKKFIDARKGDSWDMFRKLQNVRHDQPPYSKAYPKLANILDDEPYKPKGNSIENNLVVGPMFQLHDVKESDLELRNNLRDIKPMFENPQLLNFSHKEGCPAIKAGFKAIDQSKIGLVRDGVRWQW